MPRKASKAERAKDFRFLLETDLSQAERILGEDPSLIDFPVYGKFETALHFFAIENRVDLVRWLLARGANPNGIAVDESPLQVAAQLGHRGVCNALIEAGADLDRLDYSGETALHKASANGHIEIIIDLLDAGADPTIPEMCGELPIDQALPCKQDLIREIFEPKK